MNYLFGILAKLNLTKFTFKNKSNLMARTMVKKAKKNQRNNDMGKFVGVQRGFVASNGYTQRQTKRNQLDILIECGFKMSGRGARGCSMDSGQGTMQGISGEQ